MAYLYETHMHTCLSSACGKSTGKEHARRYADLGFAGIIITDHFFGGNCAVPRSLPWQEKVKQFCRGYEDAREEGEKIGLDVFFGWEQGYGDDEYLVYGLDKAWLLTHPEIEKCSRARQLELVHEGGGAVIQAHPFRMRDYMRYIRLGLRFCDGAEVANAGNQQVNDTYAYHYAQEFHLVMTAGSDNHDSSRINRQEELFGVALNEKLSDISDYVALIRNRGEIGLHVDPSRFEADPVASPVLTSYWINAQEELEATGRTWIR
ncbi:MAG: PHP domain-containing protein [Clostridia bacterium]|nr:PHP domain-containing protein [Clostridia bacterium]